MNIFCALLFLFKTGILRDFVKLSIDTQQPPKREMLSHHTQSNTVWWPNIFRSVWTPFLLKHCKTFYQCFGSNMSDTVWNWPLSTTSTCFVTKQCLIVFDRQTFPHLDRTYYDSRTNVTSSFAASVSNNSPSKPRIYLVFRNKILW